MSNVYLLHFSPRYRHAGHYAGYTTRDDVAERVEEHLAGRGAVLVRAAVAAGCSVTIARVWHDVPRRFELKIKGRGQAEYCPLCSARPRNPRLIVKKDRR